jgi:hypothetical protein
MSGTEVEEVEGELALRRIESQKKGKVEEANSVVGDDVVVQSSDQQINTSAEGKTPRRSG